MAATLFQACQDGNLQTVKNILSENKPDIEARDEQGFSALALAVRGGHVDVLKELLANGAKPQAALEQDFEKSNPQIAIMLQSAAAQSTEAETVEPGTEEPTELGEGPIHYSHSAAFNGQLAEFPIGQQQHPYGFQPQPAFYDPVPLPDQRAHAHKDSNVANLPPPEVARMIPCKFFPNCRYGDKCIFAHPVSLPPNSGSGPVSPGQGPVFYQPPPSYGYPPYGPPQHFYTMAPPLPLQYTHAGVPIPVHMPPPPHMAGPHQGESFHAPFPGQPQYFTPSQGAAVYPEGVAPNSVDGNTASDADNAPSKGDHAQESIAHAATSKEAEVPSIDSSKEKEVTIANDVDAAKPTHRRQSFNSFLHHHAVPFHPAQLALPVPQINGDTSTPSSSQAQFPRGGKMPRRGSPSIGSSFVRGEFSRRGSERPACSFFARAACKHGEDCRFPHTLPDGTDARGPNAGRSSHSFDSSRAPNRAQTGKTTRNTSVAQQVSESAPSSSAIVSVENKKPGSFSSVTAPLNSVADEKTPVAVESSTASTKSDSNARSASTNENKETNKAKTAPSTEATASNLTSATQPPNAASAAPIPAKPVVSQTQRANGNQPSSKAQVNGAKGGSQQQSTSQSNNTSNYNGSSGGNSNQAGRPGYNKSNNNSNRSHGHSNSGAAKKVVQRVPNQDDFPALGGAAPAAPSSVANTLSTTVAPKVNFSAILSAPAPVRPKPAAANGTNGDSKVSEKEASNSDKPVSTDVTIASESAPSSDVKTSVKKSAEIGIGANALDFATVAQAKVVAV